MSNVDRRRAIKLAGAFGLAGRGALLPGRAALDGQAATQAGKPIHTVLLVTKCHLDIGFTMTQAKVIQQYFDVYFPQAIRTSAEQRTADKQHYTWTTGSWLLYEYLEQASGPQRKAAEGAVLSGDLAWHALPFNWQTEMIDRSMIEGAMSFSQALDLRFGMKTIGAKMTDVPGHSRGLVAPLSDAGVRLVDIGVNAASTPPKVPDLFLWKEPGGKSVSVMYHRTGYGGIVEVPGTGVAVDVEVRNDNSGPHTPAEIAAIYEKLERLYPGADIQASTMSAVARAVDAVSARLPVVTAEIGDTWIYGCASDPEKVAGARSIAKLRRQWIAGGSFRIGDQTDRNLLQRLLLAAEHTWGTDTKSYLDDNHYRPADLMSVLDQPGYVTMTTSWEEKRKNILDGVTSLPQPLRLQAMTALQSCKAQVPSTTGMHRHELSEPIDMGVYRMRLDPSTGAIVSLQDKQTGIEWASPENPLALFTYQTLSPEQYSAYIKRYLTVETDWGPKDFGKPGIQRFGAVAQDWHPRVQQCLVEHIGKWTRVVLQLAIEDPPAQSSGNVAWPRQLFLELECGAGERQIQLRLVSLGKKINRLPEAMWLTFAPAEIEPQTWEVEKVDQPVNALDVVSGGGRAMHAVSGAVRCGRADGKKFWFQTLDAPVVAMGERSPLNYSAAQPDLRRGAHVSLFNNAWGTNYLQWSGGDWQYRFQIST